MTILRMTAVLAAVLALMPLLRHRSAALRACILAAGLLGASLLPLLEFVAPAWGAPVPSAAVFASTGTWSQALGGVWIAGVAVHLFILVVGVVRLTGIAAAADPIRDGRCADLALDIAAGYRVHAPVLLLEAQQATLPMTWGHAQPKVLLPPAARHWSDERLRAVLSHEIAHVRRRDWVLQVVALIVRAVYWPHPLVWLTCARLRLECEQACDDAVLRAGIDGPRYASHLLDLARSVLDQKQPLHASGLIARSTLEHRVRSMLLSRRDRSPLRMALAIHIVALISVVTTAAAGYGRVVERSDYFVPPPAKRLTLLLDGRIVDLSKEWPTYPNPRAGLVEGPGFGDAF